MPLQARVTLEIVHFDRRAVGGAIITCAEIFCGCVWAGRFGLMF